MSAEVRIGERAVGPAHPVYVIAEAGVNHGGDLPRALAMIDAAAGAGADAVKFQTFVPELFVAAGGAKAPYQEDPRRPGEDQLAMLRRLALDAGAHRPLAARCRQRRVEFLSTPFDDESLDLLLGLGVGAIKVSSGDADNLPFLARIAAGGRPVLLSTGMCTLTEVEAAVGALRAVDPGVALVLLQCTSCYPAPEEAANLAAISTLAAAFGVPVGYSDHTAGIGAPALAVAAGASLIEKHFTLDRRLEGPDQRASLEPRQLARVVRRVRRARRLRGSGVKEPQSCESDVKAVARKGLFARRAIRRGETLEARLIALKRPPVGLGASHHAAVLGRRAARDIEAGTPICEEDLM